MYESEAFLSRIDGIQFNLLFFFCDPWHVSLVGLGCCKLKKSSREREDFFSQEGIIIIF